MRMRAVGRAGIVFIATLFLFVACAEESFAPYASFRSGLLSKTRPVGWLGDWCESQRRGLTGHPEALGYPYDSCLWAGTISRQGNHGDGWWRYEQTAYLTDGILRLGYALGDRELIVKGEAGIDWTLDHASPEGYLGDRAVWDGKINADRGATMWPMCVFFRAMQAKYEATGDRRIPEALRRYYLNCSVGEVRTGRNMLSAEGMLWTYGKTGDRRLLELAEAAWRSLSSEPHDAATLNPVNCMSERPLFLHGVTYCEGLKVPLLLYAYTGRREYLDQALGAERKLRRDHMLPDGCPSSTEETRGNSVHWGHETCDIADYSWSLGCFLEVTGDAEYADLIERCVFNAAPGALTKDFRALQYFSNINQFLATPDSNHNPKSYGSDWAQYRPTHQTECCVGNVNRIFPNYVSRMWMTDRDGNPVAALYGPSEVDFGWGRISEETRYPFDGKVRFRFHLKSPRKVVFSYRVPGWCRAREDRGRFVRVERMFRDGDAFDVDFPMEVVYERPAPRKVVGGRKDSTWYCSEEPDRPQGVVVTRGPIVFAYPVPTERTVDDVARHSKSEVNSEFKSWTMTPTGEFGYGLVGVEAEARVSENLDGKAYDEAHPLVTITVPARRIRWELDKGRFTPDIPAETEALDDKVTMLRMVPYGATCLRLTAFPEFSGKSAEVVALYHRHDRDYWRDFQKPGHRPLGGYYVATSSEDLATERALAENAGIDAFVEDAAQAESNGYVRVGIDADLAVFERHLREAAKGGKVLIDSWNDFKSGRCLLPDTRLGDMYLRTVAKVFGRHPANEYVCTQMRAFWEGDAATNQRPCRVARPTVEDAKYGPHPRQGIDLWLPAATGGKSPVVILIHGGGWREGDRCGIETAALLSKCRAAGVALATIGYRFIDDAEEAGICPPVRASVEDAIAAIRFLKSNAIDWHLDQERIGLTGGSAGACSSLIAALTDDNSLGIRVVLAKIPQTSLDPAEMRAWIPNINYGARAFGYRSFDEWLAHRADSLPWIRRYSPSFLLRHITAGHAPTILHVATSLPPPGVLPKDPTHAAMFCVKFGELCAGKGVRFEAGDDDMLIAELCR